MITEPIEFSDIDKYVPLNIFYNVTDRYQLCHMHNAEDLSYALIMKIGSYTINHNLITLENVVLKVLTNFNHKKEDYELVFCKSQDIIVNLKSENGLHHQDFDLNDYPIKLTYKKEDDLKEDDKILKNLNIEVGRELNSVFHFDVKIFEDCFKSLFIRSAGTQICMNSVGLGTI
jgi:hypothetical protein